MSFRFLLVVVVFATFGLFGASAQTISEVKLNKVAERLSLLDVNRIVDCVSVSHWALVKNYNDVDAENDDAVMFALQSAWYRAYLLNSKRETPLLDVVSLSELQNISTEDVSYKDKWSNALEFCTADFVEEYNALSSGARDREVAK